MLKRSEVYIFSCPECMNDFWVTEDMCSPYIMKDGRRTLSKCPCCGYEIPGVLIELCRGDQCDWDLGEEVEEVEYLFYCSKCDCAFTAKASECREDFMHCVTHECLECHSKLRVFGLPNRFRERE